MMNQRPPMTGQRYDECLGILKFIFGADQWKLLHSIQEFASGWASQGWNGEF